MRKTLQASIFPSHCLLCAQAGPLLCTICTAEARTALQHCCQRCALPMPLASHTMRCGACISQPPAFDTSLAAVAYEPPFDQLIIGLKFHAQLLYAAPFAELIAKRWAERLDDKRLDVLLPVPLNATRLSARGFNQSLEICRHLSRKIGVRMDTTSAQRVLDTLPQSSLQHAERHKNIRGAFAVAPGLAGLRVGVVDDVMTTGATLNELAKTLKKAGVAEVVNLVVARAIF